MLTRLTTSSGLQYKHRGLVILTGFFCLAFASYPSCNGTQQRISAGVEKSNKLY